MPRGSSGTAKVQECFDSVRLALHSARNDK